MNAITTRTRRALVAAAVAVPVLLASVAAAAPASGRLPPSETPEPTPDLVQPVVHVELPWHFTVGAQVDRTAATERVPGQDISVFHQAVPVELTWSAWAQGEGRYITGYNFYRYDPQSGLLDPVLTNTLRTSYQGLGIDYTRPLPGPSALRLHLQYRLVAYSSNGQATVIDRIPLDPCYSEQENGTTYQDGRTVFPSAPTVVNGWHRRSGPAYDAGSVLTSNRPGATVKIPIKSWGRGQYFALEMTTGPRHGKVEVRLGDSSTPLATIDTYSPTVRHRVLVAQFRFRGGNYDLTLVNVGTPHRPTVEFDGIFASSFG